MPEDQDPSAAAAAAVDAELDVLDLDGPPAHVKGIFARHDLNGDGHLSRPEVSELITEFCELLHLEMTQAQRDQLLNEHFDAADKNRDSVLTLDEFRDFAALLDTAASALAGTGTAADAAAPDLLQKYAKLRREKKPRDDQEGSLLVDTQGRARMELFDRFDVNHDHKLDIEEAGTLLRSVLAAHGCVSLITAASSRQRPTPRPTAPILVLTRADCAARRSARWAGPARRRWAHFRTLTAACT